MKTLLSQPFTHAIEARTKKGKPIKLFYLYTPSSSMLPYQFGHLFRYKKFVGNDETLVGEVKAPRHLKHSEAYHALTTWVINDMNESGYVFHKYL